MLNVCFLSQFSYQTLYKSICGFLCLSLMPALAHAQTLSPPYNIHQTHSWPAILAVVIFIIAYIIVMTEDATHIPKSKPVVLAAGLIWGLVAYLGQKHGQGPLVTHAIEYNLMEYAELMLFLLVAMTYINAMEERRVFENLRAWLTEKGLSLIHI